MLTKQTCVKSLLLFVLTSLIPISFVSAQQLQIKQQGTELELSAQIPGSVHEVKLRIESARNAKITKISDISPLNPDPKARGPKNEERDISYPIVDVGLQPGMEGVMEFASKPTLCLLNNQYFKKELSCSNSVTVPANRLLYWENTLYAEPAAAAVSKFYIEQLVPVVDGRFHFKLQLLSPSWSGTLSIRDTDAHLQAELGQATFSTASVPLPEVPSSSASLSRERLLWSLRATVEHILNTRDLNPLSPTYNGLNLFYDLDAKTYRSPYWVWGWGPEVNVLVAANKIPGVANSYSPGELLADADKIGKASLGLIVNDPDNPAKGISFSRWDRGLNFPRGFSERIAPSDSNFLAKWAWIPLYEATGDPAYLKAAETLASATDTLVKSNEFIPQEYITDEHKWAATTIDESGFGADGLSDLYAVTKDPKYKQMTVDYINQHMGKLQREEGLWNRGWSAKGGVMPSNYNTRAMGWAMEGMLAAYRASPDGSYLEVAKKMADHMLSWQASDGAWAFIANDPTHFLGISEKGTALWSCLLYQLYDATHDVKYLAAARKALTWCIENQYKGPDPDAFGGLIGLTPHSGVGYRPFFPVECGYTSGFFGTAVVHELAIQDEEGNHKHR